MAYLLALILQPPPSVALGMILVAACPGGNISNFLTHFARGNTALSITISAFSTLGSLFFTPFNLSFWGGLDPGPARSCTTSRSARSRCWWRSSSCWASRLRWAWRSRTAGRRLAARAHKPFKFLSLVVFGLFIVGALAANWAYFIRYVAHVVMVVFLMNGLGLLVGYWSARLAGLPERDRRAVSIEVGIQNSGFGLVLVFNFFEGLGGMAIVAAWWGIWHILSGLVLATWWRRRTAPVPATAT